MPEHGARGDWPLRALACASVALAGAALAWTFAVWFRLHPHMPWQDLYVVWADILPILDRHGVDLAALEVYLKPHYAAHRITVPRLLVTLDILRFHGQGHVLYAAGWAGLAALWWQFCLAARRAGADGPQAVFAAGLAGILLLGPPGVWNLANPINCSWHLSLALAMAALLLAARRGAAGSWPSWLGAYALACAAALSTFAGVVALLLLPAAALSRGYRAAALAAAASAVLVVLQLQGIASDASIALAWQTEGADKVAVAAREALARHDAVTIALKSVRLLGWPLADTAPVAAAVLVAASLLLVGACWIGWAKRVLRRRDAAPDWRLVYLLGASLCIGVAVAAQLGRVIEQPNYAHGPSFERFHTVVSVYWAAIVGLLLGATRALSHRRRTAAWTACLALAVLVGAPWGTYLRQEVESAEYAARLYLQGEHPAWRDPVDPWLLQFRPEFVFSFDEAFARRGLAWRAPLPAPAGTAGSRDCAAAGLRVAVAGPGRGGAVALRAEWPRWSGVLARDLVLYAGGERVGRMYAVHAGDYTPAALVAPGRNPWRGLADAEALTGARVDVAVTAPLGPRYLCRLAPPAGD